MEQRLTVDAAISIYALDRDLITMRIRVTARSAGVETADIPAGSDDVPEDVVGQDCVLVSMTDTGAGMTPR